MRRSWPALGRSATRKRNIIYNIYFIYFLFYIYPPLGLLTCSRVNFTFTFIYYVDWIQMAECGVNWQTVVNTVMNLWVVEKGEKLPLQLIYSQFLKEALAPLVYSFIFCMQIAVFLCCSGNASQEMSLCMQLLLVIAMKVITNKITEHMVE